MKFYNKMKPLHLETGVSEVHPGSRLVQLRHSETPDNIRL